MKDKPYDGDLWTATLEEQVSHWRGRCRAERESVANLKTYIEDLAKELSLHCQPTLDPEDGLCT